MAIPVCNARALSWRENSVQIHCASHYTHFVLLKIQLYASNSMAEFQLSLQVYIDKTNVDDDLVKSIIRAAEDPNAAEVFYRVIGGNSGVTGGGASVNQLLNKLDNKMPMLLLWGDLDPWIGPGSAARVKKYYPKADRVGIQAGHCPHDEKPAEVDRILVEWADKL